MGRDISGTAFWAVDDHTFLGLVVNIWIPDPAVGGTLMLSLAADGPTEQVGLPAAVARDLLDAIDRLSADALGIGDPY